MDEQRAQLIRKYIVLHLKTIELVHLMQLSGHLSKTRQCPENTLDHGVDRYKETLLGAIATTFMSLCDDEKKSTNARSIWKELFPKHTAAIDRVWARRICGGESAMKSYRDRAGAHGDRAGKYFAGKLELYKNSKQVLTAMHAFLSLAMCLYQKQVKEMPDLASEIEDELFDLDLSISGGSFNRNWLKTMRLIQPRSYTKTF